MFNVDESILLIFQKLLEFNLYMNISAILEALHFASSATLPLKFLSIDLLK